MCNVNASFVLAELNICMDLYRSSVLLESVCSAPTKRRDDRLTVNSKALQGPVVHQTTISAWQGHQLRMPAAT
jgi:hypothetical protein